MFRVVNDVLVILTRIDALGRSCRALANRKIHPQPKRADVQRCEHEREYVNLGVRAVVCVVDIDAREPSVVAELVEVRIGKKFLVDFETLVAARLFNVEAILATHPYGGDP